MQKKQNSSRSIFQEHFFKFRSIKRGYYSLIIILTLYVLSFLNPILINNKALIVKFNDKYYFPAFYDLLKPLIKPPHYDSSFFGQNEINGKTRIGEPNYRMLKKSFNSQKNGNWLILTPYPYSPTENILSEIEGNPPLPPAISHFLGIDNQGRDIFARLVYGFRISLSFALLCTIISYLIGIFIGSILGFFGGKIDLWGLRFIELISVIPFIYLTMILVSIMQPSFFLLCMLIILLGGWMGITYYIRGEFYREKSKEYVLAAIASGASSFRVMFYHILPNSLNPVITFAPFSLVGYISVLVSLDFLGLGLPPPTPSWGELLNQGVADITHWWLVLCPVLVIFFTLLLIVFIGESVREAFDPKSYVEKK